MRVYYTDSEPLPLPDDHRFPARKYPDLLRALLAEGVLSPDELLPSPPATDELLALAHTPGYIRAVAEGTLSPAIQRAIGLPWSPELDRRARSAVGGSLAAARAALEDGVSGNLAGGTHHALADGGQGFCVFNDLAVVTRDLLQRAGLQRVAIVDLDVHQGNGNAAILADEPGAFVFSLHGQKNFPFRKERSTLDIGLPDGAGDEEYLQALEGGLEQVFRSNPQIVLYLAGVDVLAEDRLGRLALTMDGVARRDRMVLQTCRVTGTPVALAMGGGYARPIERTVQAHVQTYRIVKEVWGWELPGPASV